MPHKRAKLSARRADRAAKGADLPPTSNDSHMRDMPKGAMRIINAASIQEDFNRKRKERAEKDATQSSEKIRAKGQDRAKSMKIGRGESLKDFSRRVDNSMAHEVRSAVRKVTPKHGKGKAKPENISKLSSEPRPLQKRPDSMQDTDRDTTRDWQEAVQRRRVGDVAQAPPNLTKAPRGQGEDALRRKADLRSALGLPDSHAGSQKSKARIPDGVQSLVAAKRKMDLEKERELAISAYRRVKAAKLKQDAT